MQVGLDKLTSANYKAALWFGLDKHCVVQLKRKTKVDNQNKKILYKNEFQSVPNIL